MILILLQSCSSEHWWFGFTYETNDNRSNSKAKPPVTIVKVNYPSEKVVIPSTIFFHKANALGGYVTGYNLWGAERKGMFEDNDIVKEILKNVSVTIDDHFVAITGPNGGGKSTLAKMIAGIIRPTSGQILLDGEDITGLNITERARKGISFAFQQPVHFKGLTVKDLITIAAGKEMSVNEICDILSEVGLCAREYIDREINGSLSGGELKRIEIAMITARGTKLSIFDEPEAGIDLWSFNSLIKVFEKMRDEINGTILIISHQERILDIADKIIVIADGQVRKTGTKAEVLPELLNTAQTCQTLIDKA